MTPKNKEDIAILVRSIIEKDPGMIHIKDGALMPFYVNNSKYMIEVEPTDKTSLWFFVCGNNHFEDDFDSLKKQQLHLAQTAGANYVFFSNSYCERQLVSISTPFRILSKKELDFLVKNYYKNVPEKVSEAASHLGIGLFDKSYSSYYTKAKLPTDYDYREYLNFLNFIFSLPYEEQNIKANKKILKEAYSDLDYIEILAREYSKGLYFHEYFDQLTKPSKEKVVSRIKSLERNHDYDVFLLKRGFVVGEDSIIDLYKEDADSFIRNFKDLSPESQKTVIEKIYEEPTVNPQVARWLEENYTPLLREVGFLGGDKNGTR